MILLDTNIISEMMKQTPSAQMLNWIDQQEVTQLFITSITIAEISDGLHVLPQGARRNQLENAFNKAIMEAFQQRVFSFDETAAHLYGKIMGRRKEIGRPLSIPDGQIAAIARAQGAAVATRNIHDFIECGIELIDPFQHGNYNLEL